MTFTPISPAPESPPVASLEPSTSLAPGRPGYLRGIAAWCYDHRRSTVALWAAAFVVLMGFAAALGPAFSAGSSVPGSDSERGMELLAEHFPSLGTGGQSGTVVFVADQGVDDPEVRAVMTDLFATIDAGFPDATGEPQAPGATVVSPFDAAGGAQISQFGDTAGKLAFAQINLAEDIDDTESGRIGELIAERAPEIDGLEVYVGGQYLAAIEPPQTELIGVAFAVVVLIVAFGSVLAMGLPIAVAFAGVGVGMASIIIASNAVPIPDTTTMLGMMIGLGVGIDYALFIVSRHREALDAGADPRQATQIAVGTAGRSVVFAATTVIISMAGLVVVGLGWLSGMGLGASATVLATMLASLTLLPALLGFAGHRVEVTRRRGLIAAGLAAVALLGLGTGQESAAAAAALAGVAVMVAGRFVAPLRHVVPHRRQVRLEDTLSYRWSRTIQHRPVASMVVALSILAALAAPVLSIDLGWADEGNFPAESDTRRAYALLAEGFGPGFNGPFAVVVEMGEGSGVDDVERLRSAVAAVDGVAAVSEPVTGDAGERGAYLMNLVPDTAPQDAATTELVRHLRDNVVPSVVEGTGLEVALTGTSAAAIDVTDFLGSKMFAFFAAVLSVSFVVLMLVFRSIVVPLKAVVMNLLSITAAYGVVVAVFQWGWGGSLLGIEGGPINPYIPLMLFAIVFGLSMDYEVFILSRIREEYERTGDARTSVADGLASTAKVISAAAAIMVVVFGSFMFEELREIKLFGLGLALAVLLDATLVRMLLVPATMELLGSRNWWLPRWLDRLLPRVGVH